MVAVEAGDGKPDRPDGQREENDKEDNVGTEVAVDQEKESRKSHT